MEINKTNNLLSKRKKVGYAIISSKNNNYKIFKSIYLKEKRNKKCSNIFHTKL